MGTVSQQGSGHLKKYRECKRENNQSGSGRHDYRYYGIVNDVLGDKPSTSPEFVLDTSKEVTLSEDESIDGEQAKDAEDDNEATKNTDESDGVKESNRKRQPEKEKQKPFQIKRSKKGTEVRELLDAFMTMEERAAGRRDQTMMEMRREQAEEDRRLEERSRQRELEFEERRYREEQSFQRNMVQMMMGIMSNRSPNPNIFTPAAPNQDRSGNSEQMPDPSMDLGFRALLDLE